MWLVYIRWVTGRWETIVTDHPEEVNGGPYERFWVLAKLPVPKLSLVCR